MSFKGVHTSKRGSSELRDLLDEVDMEDYLSTQGVHYKLTRGSSGEQINIRECPACGKKKWKVYMNRDTGLGNCFSGSCSMSTFNKFKFIKALMGFEKDYETVEHIKAYLRDLGWRPKKLESEKVDFSVDLELPKCVDLPDDGENLEYLEDRGVTGDLANYFHLKFCEDGVFYYYDIEGEMKYQDYSQRVIIPIFDEEGKLVSYQGRDVTGTSDRKYLFPPGFASTGQYLYNAHNFVDQTRAIINEGVFDVISVKAALDDHSELRDIIPLGSFGKNLSQLSDGDDQLSVLLRLKKRGLKEVTLMWDAEKKALRDALDTCKLLASIGLKARLAFLPKGCDPNEVTHDEIAEAYYTAVLYNPANALRIQKRILTEF